MTIADLEKAYDKELNALFRAEDEYRAAALAHQLASAFWHAQKETCDDLHQQLCAAYAEQDRENENGC